MRTIADLKPEYWDDLQSVVLVQFDDGQPALWLVDYFDNYAYKDEVVEDEDSPERYQMQDANGNWFPFETLDSDLDAAIEEWKKNVGWDD